MIVRFLPHIAGVTALLSNLRTTVALSRRRRHHPRFDNADALTKGADE
jgi:hypothetical protein